MTEEADQATESGTEKPQAAFHAAIERSGSAVLTTEEVARHLDLSRERTQELLADLAASGRVVGRDVSQDPAVWYPAEWEAYVDRERFVVFPDRRQIVVDRPAQFTRANCESCARVNCAGRSTTTCRRSGKTANRSRST